MHVSRPDRVVKLLTALTSFAYYLLFLGGALVLVGLPVLKVLGVAEPVFYYDLELPVATPDLQTVVRTAWGQAPLMLDDVRGELKLPISSIPWTLLALLWSYTAAAGALMMLSLHNLRRILQRIQDGAAFDAQNVGRLRKLGTLLLAIAGLRTLAETATSIAVRRGLSADSSLSVPVGFHIDGTLVVVALVLLVLAKIFRRGADLEHEQSLVV